MAAKYALCLEVLQELHDGDLTTIAGACQRLSRRPDRKSQTAETIEARFHETKAHIAASVPSDQIETDPKTGHPINIPRDGDIESMVAFDRFRVRYANMLSAFS